MELHSVDGLQRSFTSIEYKESKITNRELFDVLTGMYTRSSKFKQCVKAFLEAGLQIEDRALQAVLLDDARRLEHLITEDPTIIDHKISQQCAYTPLENASLMHVCAEYNHVNCAQILRRHGADVNATAGLDEDGFGGQTPIFHTVNQNGNQSKEMMDLLLTEGADLNHHVKGLIWGKGFPWETFLPATNPVSYAMFGLLPQMHRNEQVIAATISLLMKHLHGIDYNPPNVPNQYLQD